MKSSVFLESKQRNNKNQCKKINKKHFSFSNLKSKIKNFNAKTDPLSSLS